MSEPGSLIRTLSGRQTARNFHSYVINEVGRAIVAGEMPVGSSLPGDAEMMDRFGVSRTVLREALKTLEAKGWNLFDRQILTWKLESGPSAEFLAAFRQVRLGLELQAARQAAQNREAEHVRLLYYWLNQRSVMTHQPEPFALAEFELHRVVAEASGNPFLRASTALLEFGIAHAVQSRLTPDLSAPAEGLAAGRTPQYEALVAAIERGDQTLATQTMAGLLGD